MMGGALGCERDGDRAAASGSAEADHGDGALTT